MNDAKWYLRTMDETFGPETEAKLVEWAKLGRIQPGQEISDDNIEWRRVEEVPFLDMRFSIDIGDGNPRGPFNRAAAEALLASGRLPPTASIVETRGPFEKVEKVEEVEDVEEVKIVEKVVVDETRVKELEGLLDEERRHTTDLQRRLDDSLRKSAEAAKAAQEKFESAMKDAVDREGKLMEHVKSLEDELRRLPQAASEVADIQAAVYSILTGESEDLAAVLEAEKREFEELKKRHAARVDKLTERRRELMKRSGANIEDMTRKALLNRPEDPRTAQIRKEFEEFRRAQEHDALDKAAKIRELTEALRLSQADGKRAEAGLRDVTQLRQEVEQLRERLQVREKELTAERQITEELRQQQAMKQQVLLARLAALESPSIGSASDLSTNQSREAKQVKLPGWMSFRK